MAGEHLMMGDVALDDPDEGRRIMAVSKRVYAHLWPTMTDKNRQTMREDVDQAVALLTRVAGQITVYPGGGGQAHQARRAANLAREVRGWLDDA